jgi:uncharacterized protein YchJ
MKKLSFTVNGTKVLRVLNTKCGISIAFDPQGGSAPPMEEFNAIWDTGATGSVISRRVAQKLALKPIGKQKVFTASSKDGPETVYEYMIGVRLPNHVIIPSVTVTEGALNGADMLIGMDIITQGDFAITHKDGKTTFSFQMPSTHYIDFVKESHDEKEEHQAPAPITKKKEPGRNDLCPCGSGKKYKHCHGKK